jgi:hypothetical protein
LNAKRDANKMQLLYSSTAPSPEFVSLSLLVKPDPSDVSPASMGEPMMIASPLATVASAAATDALQELHTHLTYVLKASSLSSNVPKEDRVAVDLLKSDERLLVGMQIFRPLAANGMGLYYRLIQGDGPMFSTFASLALASHQNNTSGGKVDKSKVLGVVLSVGISGLALAHCSSSIQYTLSQRMNDCLGLLSKIGANDVTAAKGVLLSFLVLEDECRKSNSMMEARRTVLIPELEDVKSVISPMRMNRRSSGGPTKTGSANGTSTDIALPMEQISSADTARTMIDRLALLSVAETDTFLRKYEVSGQERKANLDLTGGAKSRFRRRKGDGRDADFDNFDYKGPARQALQLPAKGSQPKLPHDQQDTDQASVTPGKTSTQIRSSKKDTSKKESRTKGTSVPVLSASRTDAMPLRPRRISSRIQFDDDTSTHAQSVSSVGSVNRVQVNIALNEDLSCSYKESQLSSCTVEGVVQVSPNCRAVFAVIVVD